MMLKVLLILIALCPPLRRVLFFEGVEEMPTKPNKRDYVPTRPAPKRPGAGKPNANMYEDGNVARKPARRPGSPAGAKNKVR